MNDLGPTEPGAPADEPGAPTAPPASRYGTKGLEAYLDAHRERFTEEALAGAAVAAGWERSVVDATLVRTRDKKERAPVRARARLIVRSLYVGGFAVLALLMVLNPANAATGAAAIGSIVLALTLGVGYGLVQFWFNHLPVGRAISVWNLGILLSIPVIFWVAVTGLCLATGLPTNPNARII